MRAIVCPTFTLQHGMMESMEAAAESEAAVVNASPNRLPVRCVHDTTPLPAGQLPSSFAALHSLAASPLATAMPAHEHADSLLQRMSHKWLCVSALLTAGCG